MKKMDIMKKMGKKGLVLVLSLTMVMGMMTGCGRSDDTASTAESGHSSHKNKTEAATSDEYICYETDNGCYDTSPSYCEEPCEDYYYYDTEEYSKAQENGFSVVTEQPFATFSANVDTASYANVRRMIEDGYTLDMIYEDAVRAEEFINYFHYDLEAPKGDDKFSVATEIAACPWNEDHQLMMVGMATQELDMDDAPESNLVFLIDVSGSMADDDKLPLLQQSFKELVEELDEDDTVSIVTYASGVEVVLDGAKGSEKRKITEALEDLMAGGSTNGEGGIQKAYQTAEKHFIKGGNNRVIMATDGDLNVGVSDTDDLEDLIEKKRDSGVYLSVLGFGAGNLKDEKMERLADCGNGNYSYIDSLFEAKKVMVEEMGSTLVTVADDVKIQVEFNPVNVYSYRLIGYENHMLAAQDFNDDTVDAKEIGAGHQIVALFEVIPAGSKDAVASRYSVDQVDLDVPVSQYENEYAYVGVRYKEPGASESDLINYTFEKDDITTNPSENFQFAAMVAEFAMILSDSEYKGTSNFEDIMTAYKELDETDEYQDEFYSLVRLMAKRG